MMYAQLAPKPPKRFTRAVLSFIQPGKFLSDIELQQRLKTYEWDEANDLANIRQALVELQDLHLIVLEDR